jgi:soluble lytic murein transglycosylase
LKNNLTLFTLAFSIIVLQSLVTPNSAVAAKQLSITQQRALYLQAKSAFEKKDNKLADRLTLRLKKYSLYPYLRLLQVRRDIKSMPNTQIKAFIKSYPNSPIAKKAQASYLQKLANNKQWSLYAKNYKQLPLTSAYYSCYNLQAQINTGQTKNILPKITKLWNVGKSQPKPCDPVFSYWIKRGKLTSDIAFERSWKAINNKKYSIAKFAQKKVKKPQQINSLNLFWKVQKDIQLIAAPKTLSKRTLHNADIAAYAIRKLAVKKTDLALETWLRDRKRFKFSNKQLIYLNTYFGNKYAKSTFYNPKAPGILQKIDPDFKYDEVSEWKTRLALVKQDWEKVIQLIAKMPKELRSQNRWIYWLEVAKQRKNPKKYKAKFNKILQDRDFYSFAAAQQSAKPYKLNNKSTKISNKTMRALLKRSAVQRMSELVKHQETSKAYQEWRLLRKDLNKQQKIAMGYLASQWGWYIQGIRIAAKLKAWDEIAIRFPRSKNKLFAQLGVKKGIGSTWPIAIARQESAYNQYAKSSAGARGFMQLMPATAKSTAKKFNIPYNNKSDLFDPFTNISLGTAYLSEMLGRFNNKAYSSAAYNAGPHRVERWHKSRGHLPLDIWIETIPFDETRKYVQNVLTYSVIYDLLNKTKPSMFNAKDKARLTLSYR